MKITGHRWAVVLFLVLIVPFNAGASDAQGEEGEGGPPEFSGPDFKEVLDLQSAGNPQIAPDGGAVLYTVGSVDWEENRYDSEIWLARTTGAPFQLTRTDGKSSSSPRWSPDARQIAFLADRGNGTQIWVISATGGEAHPLTAVDDGVSAFEWSPDGLSLAVAITDPEDKRRKKLEEKYGAFAVEDTDFRMTHLWVLDVAAARAEEGGAALPGEDDAGDSADPNGEEPGDDDPGKPSAFRRLTDSGPGSDTAYTVDTFRWSPDGEWIAFDVQPDPRVESFSNSDIAVVNVATGEARALVERPGPDSDPHWSPDGKWVLFSTGNGRFEYFLNSELARVPAAGGEIEVLTGDFDEDTGAAGWFDDGICFIALDRTKRRLYRLDPENGGIEPIVMDGGPDVIWSVDFSGDGRSMAFQGEDSDSLREIYRLDAGSSEPRRITDMTAQTRDWQVGSREIVQWRSADGASIEGVLLKPDDFDPTEKHPLLVVIHGGPSWLSFPSRVYSSVYPVQQWLEKGAVVLMPNYRGSAGYGEAFRSLNVGNLGVGDAWDVLSGVDFLIEQGFVDPQRMGAMGWSQGGYISAFLTTTSDRFQAISVGAGISNWMTYYVNTDVHPFTRHYLEGTPWDNPDAYAKTSPMTTINNASTPTLIQHGEFDRRVPTPNAYELYQGLEDVGVPVDLIIYKGFGHGITKPRERLAAVWHNWRFFARWIWDERVEIPAD